MAAIGIDAEPARPLPAGLIETVAAPAELRPLAELRLARPELPWELLLFCAKEAVYKAWFPLTGHRLGFADVLVEFAATGAFTAQVTATGCVASLPTGTAAARVAVRDRRHVRHRARHGLHGHRHDVPHHAGCRHAHDARHRD